MTDFTKYENTLKFLQRNDRNGDFLEVITEYHEGEIPLDIVHEICETTLKDWIENHLTEEDTKERQQLQSYLDYINN